MRYLWPLSVCAWTVALCFPFLRSVAWFADEGVLLHAANRMIRGEKLYVDFFEFIAPGGFLLTAGWLSLTEVSFPSARVLALISIVAIACCLYLACERVSRSAPLSAAIALAWVVMTQGEPTQLSHHWITTALCCASLWALLTWVDQPRWGWLILAGMTAGAAVTVTQSRGALVVIAGLAAFHWRKDMKPAAAYIAAAATVPLAIALYLASQGLLWAAFESVILWPAWNYHGVQSIHYGANPSPQNALLVFSFPIGAALVLLFVIRGRRAVLADRTFRLCLAFAVAAFLGLLVRPDSFHIALASPLVVPLIVHCLTGLKLDLGRYRLALVGLAIVVMIAPALTFVGEIHRAATAPTVETPRGRIRLMSPIPGAEDALRAVIALPEGPVFFYPYSPLLPFLSARVHPSKIDIFVPDYTTPEQYREAEAALSSAAWVMIDRATLAALPSAFPAIRNARPSEATILERALEERFAPHQTFGAFELRKRR